MDRVGRILLLVTIVCGALVVPGVAGAGPNDPTVLFGVYAQPNGGLGQQASLEAWEDLAGREAAVVREYLTWNEDFPTPYHNWLATTGRVPMISLNTGGTNYDWADVAAAAPGSQLYNQLVDWARRFRDYEIPFYFTYDHEPEAASNNNQGSQQDYINAWRRVVDIFRAQGVDNATYLWITTAWAYGVGQNTRRYAPRWYPGDAWVDVLGADAYNWHDCADPNNTNWRSLAQVTAGFRQWAAQEHPDKPLTLPEYGTVEDSDFPNRKAQWYADAQALFKQPANEQFVAVLMFNALRSVGCEWGIDSSPQTLAAFRTWGADVYYTAQGLPGSPSPVGISVDVSANPTSVSEPGGQVAFPISVTNISDDHAVNLTGLSDNRTGNLDGAGTCNVPTVIPAGGAYNCSHQVAVNGSAGSNYSVTVTASGTSDGQAVSDQDTASVAIVGDASGQVLLVVNNAASLTSGETALRNRMTSLGYDVDTISAASANAGDAAGHGAVLISASVSEFAASDKFRNVSQPVIIWKPWLYDAMDMSAANGSNVTASAVAITDAAHPLAAGFSGSVTVVSPASLMARGTPGGDGHVVATVSGVAALFVYEAGDDLADGSAAAGCRIAYPLHTNTATALNANGWALFENALAWAVGGCAGAPPPPPPPPGGDVLFVVANNGSLSGGDQAVVDRLEDTGHTVVVRGASAATTADAAGKALIVISSNAGTAGVGTKFRDVSQPVIIYKPFSYDAMEMTPGDGGSSSVTSIAITSVSHPLAAGLSGTVQIVSSSNRVATGSPSPGATVVATAGGAATLFVFEPGDTLANGSPAAGCRIGFPAHHETPASYNANGWRLFDTAVEWSIAGCGT